MEEKCLDCKWCEIIENGAYGFLGESLLMCAIDEEDTEDISVCFEPKENRYLKYEVKRMEEEWDNDICCATCRYGYLVEDVNEGEKIHCKKKDEYMPTDGVCGDYEY